jgi:spore germination cell wall hydrolase CwlJ-like protein
MRRRQQRRGHGRSPVSLFRALRTLVPWCLASGLVVSFTAEAGQWHDDGVLALGERPAGLPFGTLLLPPSLTVHDLAIIEGDPPLAAAEEPDMPPRPLWRAAGGHDVPDGLVAASADAALLMPDAGHLLQPGQFTAQASFGPATGRFVPLRGHEGATSEVAHAQVAPHGAAHAGLSGGHTAGRGATGTDGATPAVPKAVRLASTTPGAMDFGLNRVARGRTDGAGAVAGPQAGRTEAPRLSSRYAGLMSPRTLAREARCLAEAVYFEARSEPESGQAAVAQVVLNRAQSGLYPDSICGVVYQNRHRYLACQFTFACEGKPLTVTEPGPWRVAQRIARDVLEGRIYSPKVGNATHYHANYVRPWWARKMEKRDKVGRHIFYFERPADGG